MDPSRRHGNELGSLWRSSVSASEDLSEKQNSCWRKK